MMALPKVFRSPHDSDMIDLIEQYKDAMRGAQKSQILRVGDRVQVVVRNRRGPIGIIEALPPHWNFDDWRDGRTFGLCSVIFLDDGKEHRMSLAPEVLERLPDEAIAVNCTGEDS